MKTITTPGRIAFTAVALVVSAFGQAKPAFEVATVRPAAPLDMAKMAAAIQSGQMPKLGAHIENGRAEYTYVDLTNLIALAYGVKPYQITGPDWLSTQRFDIVAKMPDGSSKDDAPKMLQSLLEDRLRLVVHHASEEHPVLALVVGKGGPKLKESSETPVAIDENAPLKPGESKMDSAEGPIRMTIDKDGSAAINMGLKGKMSYKINPSTMTMHLDGSMITMPGFVDMLMQFSKMGGTPGRQIVDMTELTGHYEVAMDFAMADLLAMARNAGMDVGPAATAKVGEASDPSGAASSMTAAVQALGLKLESRKAMVDQFVVDHVEKTPTEN